MCLPVKIVETTASGGIKMWSKEMFSGAIFTYANDEQNAYVNRYANRYALTLYLSGTSFQLKVWRTLLEIPYGTTTTYGDIASKIGHPKAYRAVGTAVGANPMPVIIPCHRVLPSSGKIGNYSWGGPKRKIALLESEKQIKN